MLYEYRSALLHRGEVYIISNVVLLLELDARRSRLNSILSLHFDDIKNGTRSRFHITTCFSEPFYSYDSLVKRKIEIHQRVGRNFIDFHSPSARNYE